MFFLVNKYLIPKGFRGLTLYPFVFLKYPGDKTNAVFVNHERIHLRQQIELLILPFFIWYIFEFLFLFLKYNNKNRAYRSISFEREAYSNESDLDYLNKRKFFGFWKYLFEKK
ncbi:hypothetical protein SAMN05192550_1364 [Flavobacterium glycines]|uniref:DUF4157 domain-containing protein n=1 Tax=Flavobacterium glycines TaxID=551990 RepID=A0A1B9DR50_9FLAO|nr:hypothetical protein [Flavobacterium glycines]OCB72179.1 hypothetical protein FBGL_05780 [Flavobacterium glycines]GEL09631.1 hypothetical protein FGL01_03700 [Flavobacterium glycines]SDI99656.1 hypothetical protein SAMN05192550_1364 [Flavobacterium glycines]